jgi:hypothetical protein
MEENYKPLIDLEEREKLSKEIKDFNDKNCKNLASFVSMKIKKALSNRTNYAKIYRLCSDEYEEICWFNKKKLIGNEIYYDKNSGYLLTSLRCKNLIDYCNRLGLQIEVNRFYSSEKFYKMYICISNISLLLK